nr:c-type cytochrome [Bordetella sp. 15P40C-2]
MHGALVRPAKMRWDGQRYVGTQLIDIDIDATSSQSGVVQVVRLANYVGVVAVSAVQARQAAEALRVRWQSRDIAANRASGEATDGEAPAYTWHTMPQAGQDNPLVTAWSSSSHATVWLSCPPSYQEIVRAELGALLGLAPERITLVESGVAHRSHPLDVLDAAADASLLSRAVGRPVRLPVRSVGQGAEIRLHRRATAPSRQHADTTGGATSPSVSATDAAWISETPWALRPSLARLLSQPMHADPVAWPQVMDSPVQAPAGLDSGRPLTHASLAELEALQVFAQETWLDEQAAQSKADPVAYRLAQLPPGPARTLTQRVAEQANWAALGAPREASRLPHEGPSKSEIGAADSALTVRRHDDGATSVLRGRGFAAAHVRDAETTENGSETWAAWVVEVEVEPKTGRVDVTRLVVGHDSQSLQTAQQATVREQDPLLLNAARRLLQAPASFDDWGAAGAGASFAQTDFDVASSSLQVAGETAIDRPVDSGQLALDGVMTLPAAAAIGNAIFNATGVRLREVPFNAAKLRDELAGTSPLAKDAASRGWLRRSGVWLAAGASAVAGLVSMAWPLKPAIAPTAGPDVSLYSAAAIERGRLVAAAGDCVVCHTAPNGKQNAGGLALDTPFGTIYTTNITPDNETGIGQWSYRAFERAMREGVHRDGRQLYPAFPYTAFAKMTDADMQALYAYLMVQPPVRSEPPKTELAFPYNMRGLLAGWNVLFHESGVYQPDPTQSLAWNRGAYLVQGAGHCAACHSPRNALGAEKTGIENYLAGGEAEGWEAPALNRLATGARPWTEDSLVQYLRTGYSANHGVAAGPMAPVIHGLAEMPESDVRAIATYLLNLPGSPKPAAAAETLTADASARVFAGRANGERIYQNACAVCHEASSGPTLFGVKPLLSTNTNLYAATPDNLVQVILHGIQNPANDELGYMPGFKDSLDDDQVQDLLSYLRARFAPQEPEWTDSRALIGRIRDQAH